MKKFDFEKYRHEELTQFKNEYPDSVKFKLYQERQVSNFICDVAEKLDASKISIYEMTVGDPYGTPFIKRIEFGIDFKILISIQPSISGLMALVSFYSDEEGTKNLLFSPNESVALVKVIEGYCK